MPPAPVVALYRFTRGPALWSRGLGLRRAPPSGPIPRSSIRINAPPLAPPAPCPAESGGAFLCPPPCPVKPAPAARALCPLNLPPAPMARAPCTVPPDPLPRGPCPAIPGPRAVHRVQRAVGRARVADPGICHPRFVITKKRAPGRAIRAAGSCTSAPRIRAATRHPGAADDGPQRAGRAIRAARRVARGPGRN
jgi:hypothetical protein